MDLTIDRSVPFKPPVIMKVHLYDILEQDDRSLKLHDLDITRIKLVTCQNEGEGSVTVVEWYRRLKSMNYIRLDTQILRTLWHNEQFMPESWKEKFRGATWPEWWEGCPPNIYFFGTVYSGSNYSPSPRVFFTWYDDKRWREGYHLFHECVFGSNNLAAVLEI